MATDTTTSSSEEVIDYLHSLIDAGEYWYTAVLKAMARWEKPEETIDGRHYQYLIGGEAFDWLTLAERLVDELEFVDPEERDALLYEGRPPIDVDEDEFQVLIGTPKYQAYLNFLYGVIVEEALQVAMEEEVAKENHGHVWSAGTRDGETAFHRIYGRGQGEMLLEFEKERGMAPADEIEMWLHKEFTYWLFKYRYRSQELERVASDTRKGLAALSRIEAARHRRLHPEPPEPAPSRAHADAAERLRRRARI